MDLKILRATPPWEWPKNTGKELQRILMESRTGASDRLIAVELAGEPTVITDDLAGVLLAILGSPGEPEKVRAKAAISLGPVLEEADMDGFEDPDDVPISESMFHTIQESLKKLYFDDSIPKLVRRRILEAAVRAPEDWHKDAIHAAYASGDRDWMLTAVFAMRWVRGFDDQILDALKSADPQIHVEAVEAAGNWELDAAWPHVAALVQDPATPKPLLLAAIDSLAGIRPKEAGRILVDLADSDDEEIAEAADEAMMMADAERYDPDDEEEDDDWIN
jgi:hypothetical protein